LWDKFKTGFSTKKAKEVIQQADAPIDPAEQQAAQAAAQQAAQAAVQQPAAPVAAEPAEPVQPVAAEPAAPVAQQPAATPEVQLGDIQQPTETNPTA